MVKAIWAVACSILVLLVETVPLAMPAFALDAAGAVENSKAVPPGANDSPAGANIPPAARRPVPPLQSSINDPAYRLGPEDQLRISVWDNKDLTLDLVVRPDGKISMPLIQDVVAADLTAAQLANEIQQKLAAYIVNPEVSVIVLQVNAPKYYLIGYVAHPGTFPLRGDTSVLQALALAGGFTQFASPRSIKLIRNMGGKQEIRKINYYNLIEDGGEGNYLLKSGDTIVVP